jgi:rhodanese-related sulfurtransferase
MQSLQNHLNEINWDKEVIFICRSWARSWYITKVLNSNWYDSKNLAWWIDILRFNCEECMAKWEMDEDYFE